MLAHLGRRERVKRFKDLAGRCREGGGDCSMRLRTISRKEAVPW